MCGIVGSNTLSTATSLAERVKERGTQRWSLTVIDRSTWTIIKLCREEGEFRKERIEELIPMEYDTTTAKYFIIHIQSPTSKVKRHHPAYYGYYHLWHNGMKDSRYLETNEWDTSTLVRGIDEVGLEFLDSFQGSFACILHRHGHPLSFFRNAISPLYMNGNLTLCSKEFEGSEKVAPNWVFSFGDHAAKAFNNTYNPYGTN